MHLLSWPTKPINLLAELGMTRAHAILILPPVLVLPQSRKMMMGGGRKRVDSTKEEGERNGTHERKIDNVKIDVKGSNKPWIRGGPSKVPVYRGGPKLQHGILVKRGRSGCIVPRVGHLATNNGYLPCGLRKDASRHGIRAWKALSNPMECWRWHEFHLLAHLSVQIVFDPSNAGWLEVELPSGQTYWPN